jgi:hypothetical protein
MMDELTEVRRAKFDVFCQEHYYLRGLDTDRAPQGETDDYADMEIQVAWEVFNAALDSAAVELPDRMDRLGCSHVIEACSRACHAAGVRTK